VQTRGNRPLIRLALTVALFGVLADFSENALVFSSAVGNAALPIQTVFSVIKYGSFALAGVLAFAVIPNRGKLGLPVKALLLTLFPVSAALAVANMGANGLFGLEAKVIATIIASVYLGTMLILAYYALILGKEEHA